MSLAFDEVKQVGVDRVCMRSRHAVREALVGLQRAFLQQLCRQWFSNLGRARQQHSAVDESYSTGVRMGAPLFLTKTTRNFAGSVLLALRPTR